MAYIMRCVGYVRENSLALKLLHRKDIMRKHKYEVYKVIGKHEFREGLYKTKKLARQKKKELKSEYPWSVKVIKVKVSK